MSWSRMMRKRGYERPPKPVVHRGPTLCGDGYGPIGFVDELDYAHDFWGVSEYALGRVLAALNNERQSGGEE